MNGECVSECVFTAQLKETLQAKYIQSCIEQGMKKLQTRETKDGLLYCCRALMPSDNTVM